MDQDESILDYTNLTTKISAILGTSPDNTVTPGGSSAGFCCVTWHINEPALPVDDEGDPLEDDEPPHTVVVMLYHENSYIWVAIYDRALAEPRPSALAIVGLCALYGIDCRLSMVADSIRYPFSDLEGDEVSEAEAACCKARMTARGLTQLGERREET